jgi:hypothetical protein
MVLLYAVPLLLFAGTVSTPRAELSQDLPLLVALCVAIVGLYGAVLLSSRFAFRRRLSTSALAALTASAPAVPFSAVLGYLFGGPGAIPIAMAWRHFLPGTSSPRRKPSRPIRSTSPSQCRLYDAKRQISALPARPSLEKPDEFNRKLRDVLKEFATKK